MTQGAASQCIPICTKFCKEICYRHLWLSLVVVYLIHPGKKDETQKSYRFYRGLALQQLQTKGYEKCMELPYDFYCPSTTVNSAETNYYQSINLVFCQLHMTYTKLLIQNFVKSLRSKAFDKDWYVGLLFKLKSVGGSDSLLYLIESFLSNRFQRELLSGQTSESLPAKEDVPQGSIIIRKHHYFLL